MVISPPLSLQASCNSFNVRYAIFLSPYPLTHPEPDEPSPTSASWPRLVPTCPRCCTAYLAGEQWTTTSSSRRTTVAPSHSRSDPSSLIHRL